MAAGRSTRQLIVRANGKMSGGQFELIPLISTYFQLIPVNSSYFHFPDPRGGMYSRISRFKKIPGRELGRFIPAWSTGRDLLY
jgi:hypothetical protein